PSYPITSVIVTSYTTTILDPMSTAFPSSWTVPTRWIYPTLSTAEPETTVTTPSYYSTPSYYPTPSTYWTTPTALGSSIIKTPSVSTYATPIYTTPYILTTPTYFTTPLYMSTPIPTYAPVSVVVSDPGVATSGVGYCGSGPMRVGYVTSWTQNKNLSSDCAFDVATWNASQWTHVIYAYGSLNGNTVSLSPAEVNYIHSIQSRGVKTIVSFGGYGSARTFASIVQNPVSMQAFVDSVAILLKDGQIDGVNLEWEYPRSFKDASGQVIDGSDGDLLAEMLLQLRTAVGGGKILSMALPLGKPILNFPLDVLATQLDFISVLGYDQHGPWDSTIQPSTANQPIAETITTILNSGFPSSKVLLGLGFYGRSYRLSTPATCASLGCGYIPNMATPGICSGKSGILYAGDVADLWKDPKEHIIVRQDGSSGTSWFTTDDDDLVTFDSVQDYRSKDYLAKSSCLGGTAVWSIDIDPHGDFVFW
ncbi:hypothetical protein HDU76_007631, partial [Blyttiomyces sp. JEL0837]